MPRRPSPAAALLGCHLLLLSSSPVVRIDAAAVAAIGDDGGLLDADSIKAFINGNGPPLQRVPKGSQGTAPRRLRFAPTEDASSQFDAATKRTKAQKRRDRKRAKHDKASMSYEDSMSLSKSGKASLSMDDRFGKRTKSKKKRSKAEEGSMSLYDKSGKASYSMSLDGKSAKASYDFGKVKDGALGGSESYAKKKEGGDRFEGDATNGKRAKGGKSASAGDEEEGGAKSEKESSMSLSKSAKADGSMSMSKSAKSDDGSMSMSKSAKADNSMSYSKSGKGSKSMSYDDDSGKGGMGRFKCAKGSKSSDDSMSYSSKSAKGSYSFSMMAKSAKAMMSYNVTDDTGRFDMMSYNVTDDTGRSLATMSENVTDATGRFADRIEDEADDAAGDGGQFRVGTKSSKRGKGSKSSKGSSMSQDDSMSYDPCAKSAKIGKSKGGKGQMTKAPSASPTITPMPVTPQPTDIPTPFPTWVPTGSPTLCPSGSIYCQCFEEPNFPDAYPEWTSSSLSGPIWELTTDQATCGVQSIVSPDLSVTGSTQIAAVNFFSNPMWPDGYLYFSVYTTVNTPNDKFEWFVQGVSRGEAMDDPFWTEYRVFLTGNGMPKAVSWVYTYNPNNASPPPPESFEAYLDNVYFVPGVFEDPITDGDVYVEDGIDILVENEPF